MVSSPAINVVVEWKPFFLDDKLPKWPKQGVDKKMHYNMKFGKDRVEAMVPRMRDVAAAENPPIHMAFGGQIGNSLDSHRLIHWAASNGKPSDVQDAILESLFKAYFEEEKNIADRTVLSDVIKRALPNDNALCAEAEAYIASDAGVDEVLKEAETLRLGYRITGVPFFVIDNKYGISGAQDAQSLASVFAKVAAEAGVVIPTNGDHCDGGKCVTGGH